MSQHTFSSSNAVQATELDLVEDANVSSLQNKMCQYFNFPSMQLSVTQVVKTEVLVFIPIRASVRDNTLDLFVRHVSAVP